MNERISFLREQTISAKNKIKRTPIKTEWSTAYLPYSLPERKALGLKMILDNMPLYIGESELIVGTRTILKPNKGNENGEDIFEYGLNAGVPYINESDISLFGKDESWYNKTHYTPDMGILLKKGVGGILSEVEERLKDSNLNDSQVNFLNSVHIAYSGLSNLFARYSDYAKELANSSQGKEKDELLLIAENCEHLKLGIPKNLHQAAQLLWLGHLVTNIESFEFINYGRLDVILNEFITDESDEEILEILCCLLLKMYDQVDVVQSYLHKYAAQLVVTLGGVLENGENAVSKTSLLFLDAIAQVRLPEPEFNLRINSKNPPEFLEKAAALTISGCNMVSYYNDEMFIENLIKAGVKPEHARCYGFDLCQDINIPGKGDYYVSAIIRQAELLMQTLYNKDDYESFEELYTDFKANLTELTEKSITAFNEAHASMLEYRDGDKSVYFSKLREGKAVSSWGGRSLMCPLPYLSALYEGSIENAFDLVEECYPDKNKGAFLGTSTECINSLAAIKSVVYDKKLYTLKQVVDACKNNYEGEELMRKTLWAAPKWGNDNDYVDLLAKDMLEFGLKEIRKYNTASGGVHLSGIHQPHPVATGDRLGATPEGRLSCAPTAVTLTPESGTMKNGPTAALKSGSKVCSELVQWNYCVMINYFASAFTGNDGVKVFTDLIKGYFADGGMQHQPNVLDANELKAAQLSPENYKDLIVRLWGVSAHFVDLPLKLQNEMINRFSG